MKWYLIFLFVVLFLSLASLQVELYLNGYSLLIKLFNIPVGYIKDDKLIGLANSIVQKSSNQSKKQQEEMKYQLKAIKIKEINVNYCSIIKNPIVFSLINLFIYSSLPILYEQIKVVVPNSHLLIKRSKDNELKVRIKVSINLFKSIFYLIKGKIIYGRKQRSKNAIRIVAKD